MRSQGKHPRGKDDPEGRQRRHGQGGAAATSIMRPQMTMPSGQREEGDNKELRLPGMSCK